MNASEYLEDEIKKSKMDLKIFMGHRNDMQKLIDEISIRIAIDEIKIAILECELKK